MQTIFTAKDSMAASRWRSFGVRLSSYKPLWAALYVTALPVCLVHELLIDVWDSGPPRAWDGSGHYGIAQIYAQSIFPDTFGWTPAHFGGMPFPNFYPPLFFWIVALLSWTGLFSFLTAFKALVVLPLLLIPASIWFMARSVSDGNDKVAFLAALFSVYPLLSPRFGGQAQWASGLDYFSTLSIGIYTQPLGFVLLLAWYAVYVKAQDGLWRFLLASLLLALAVLANFLNGIAATLMVSSTLLFDLLSRRRMLLKDSEEAARARRRLAAHALSPLVSFGLALFWVAPMLSAYEYLVTRPFTMVIFTRDMMIWFVLAGVGFLCWFRRATPAMKPYTTTCLILAGILIFSASVAPRWLPLQANRFSPVLYFLLSVPIGYLAVTAYEMTRDWLSQRVPRLRPLAARLSPFASLLLLLPMAVYYVRSQKPDVKIYYKYQAWLANYPSSYGAQTAPVAGAQTAPVTPAPMRPTTTASLPAAFRGSRPADLTSSELIETLRQEHSNDAAVLESAAISINGVLSFAREHRDGRYLVEIPAQYRASAASFDSRTLNSYLGAQGNETLTVVFREASPNSIFMFPQVGALSYNPDNFGFSSALSDDIDFFEQPISKHLERVRFLGARYLVINSEQIKERLAQEPDVGQRFNYGSWSVFELRDGPPPLVRALPYRPAMLVSDFTLKGRGNNERTYVRFVEEQFADGWFDVLLARAPSTKLDLLGSMNDLNQFGAIILDTYDCNRCDIVYRQLKEYAQTRPLILLMRDASLFNRIRYSIGDFPMARVIERTLDDSPGAWLDNSGPMRHYQSSQVRQEWAHIRRILEQYKIPADSAGVSGEITGDSIQINYMPSIKPELGVPVLVSATYHPNWQSDERIYAANPMFMLTFVRESTRLTFSRRQIDRLGLWTSACTLGLLVGFTIWHGFVARIGFFHNISWPRGGRKRK